MPRKQYPSSIAFLNNVEMLVSQTVLYQDFQCVFMSHVNNYWHCGYQTANVNRQQRDRHYIA